MRLRAAHFFDPKPRGNYPRRGSLTDAQVVKIRFEYARAYKSGYRLAAEYGVSQANINGIVQGSSYKAAGGLITWPGDREITPKGKNRGHCWDVACMKPIAASGWAQRMHMCDDCFRINGGKKGRSKEGKERTKTCPECGARFAYYSTSGGFIPKTCSAACGIAQMAKSRSQRPDDLTKEKLYELYWGRGLTLKQVATRLGSVSGDAVRLWLIADGIALRLARRRRLSCCAVVGCGQPIHEKKASYGKGYGTMCYAHGKERDTKRRHFYEDQMQQERGGDLMRAIAQFTAGLPEAVKVDAEQDIMVAALSGDIALPLSRESVKPLIAKVFRENADGWKFVSIQAPTRDGEDAQTWGERLGI